MARGASECDNMLSDFCPILLDLRVEIWICMDLSDSSVSCWSIES